MRERFRREKGGILVLTAAAMVALLGFVAISIDGGYLYYRRARLQDISDSVALAASAQIMRARGSENDKKLAALETAVRCLEKNGIEVTGTSGFTASVLFKGDAGLVTLSFSDGCNRVGVDIDVTTDLFFARALSKPSTPVRVKSEAYLDWDPPNVVPLSYFYDDYVPYKKYQLNYTPGDGVHGNYGYVDFTPSSKFRHYLENGYDGEVPLGINLEILTYPGVSNGQVRQALESRINGCTGGCHLEDLDGNNDGSNVVVHIDSNCPRVVILPMVSGLHQAHGKDVVTIIGFLRFFIESYDPNSKVLTGWCLGEVTEDEINGYVGAVNVVKLVR